MGDSVFVLVARSAPFPAEPLPSLGPWCTGGHPHPQSHAQSTTGLLEIEVFPPFSCAVAVKFIPQWLIPLVGCIDFCSSLLVIFCRK